MRQRELEAELVAPHPLDTEKEEAQALDDLLLLRCHALTLWSTDTVSDRAY
jgi:hypothetical protein